MKKKCERKKDGMKGYFSFSLLWLIGSMQDLEAGRHYCRPKKCKAVYAVINLKTLKKSFRAFPIWGSGQYYRQVVQVITSYSQKERYFFVSGNVTTHIITLKHHNLNFSIKISHYTRTLHNDCIAQGKSCSSKPMT